jgi:hypothetical protein
MDESGIFDVSSKSELPFPQAVCQFRSLVSIFYLNQLIYYLLHFTRILKTICVLKLSGQLFSKRYAQRRQFDYRGGQATQQCDCAAVDSIKYQTQRTESQAVLYSTIEVLVRGHGLVHDLHPLPLLIQ